MKKTITLITSVFVLAFASVNAQSVVSDFEGFTLPADSFYHSVTGADWSTSTAVFRYNWTLSSFGDYWSSGSAYTNKRDTVNAYPNLYSCRPKFGYNNSNTYVTAQDGAIIVLKAPYDKVDGLYITNSNYAYKSMKNGDSFAKKFGGATGNDPDWFKVTIKGYFNGSLINDSSEFYLADFRFSNNTQDYIVNNWQWVNTANLGQVDSIKFFMYSSDVTGGYINTPTYFSFDNLTISDAFVGLAENTLEQNLQVYPNPFSTSLTINIEGGFEKNANVTITDITGKVVLTEELNGSKNQLNLTSLEKGIYFAEIRSNNSKAVKKIIKN